MPGSCSRNYDVLLGRGNDRKRGDHDDGVTCPVIEALPDPARPWMRASTAAQHNTREQTWLTFTA